MGKLIAFLRCDSGATAIEYSLIAVGISIMIVGGVTAMGGKLATTFKQRFIAGRRIEKRPRDHGVVATFPHNQHPVQGLLVRR